MCNSRVDQCKSVKYKYIPKLNRNIQCPKISISKNNYYNCTKLNFLFLFLAVFNKKDCIIKKNFRCIYAIFIKYNKNIFFI